MRISTKGRYGLRLMTELTVRAGQGPVPVELLSARLGVSGKYLHIFAATLREAGLVRAVRGPKGGYALACDPARVTAYDVVQALEGSLAPVACVEDRAACPRAATCVARGLWCEVDAAVQRVLSGATLAFLATQQQAAESAAPAARKSPARRARRPRA
jgi:Rrf2 family protein